MFRVKTKKSQHKNKDKAMKILRSRIYDVMEEQRHKEIADEKKIASRSGDRSERIRTYNFPQSRVTDHRINLTLYKLEQILDGNLDEIIDALVTADQAANLQVRMIKEIQNGFTRKFKGKTVVITGGSGILCREFAYAYAKQGMNVAVLGRTLSKLEEVRDKINELGGNGLAVVCDVVDKDSVINAKKVVNDTFGKVDILVNGAGGNHPKGTTTKRIF